MDGKIYSSIISVMEDLDAIGKDKRTSQYQYRGVDDVMNALNPALKKHGVFIAPEVLEQTREDRQTTKGSSLVYSILKIRFRFYADDGSYIDAVTIGEGMDYGDKASNKAMSVAFKYACFQVFCIPTKELVDPDGEIPDPNWRAGGNPPVMNDSSRRPSPPSRDDDARNQQMIEEAGKDLIDKNKIATIISVIRKKGATEASVLERYKITRFEQMTVTNWTQAMKILNKMPDAERSA